jgi:hypothetical protein
MSLIPLFLAPLSLGVAFFVETSSWWIRVEAKNDNFGLFISRSNIYLYSGRFFSLVFTALIALMIESGSNSSQIAFLFSVTFLVSFFIQILIVHRPFRRAALRLIAILLRLPKTVHHEQPSAFEHFKQQQKEKYKLFLFTLIASTIFGLGISLPLFLAAVFIENRLLLSNLAQAINALGMIVTLLFVDQKLYAAFDNSALYPNLLIYTIARSLAFFIVSIIFILLWFMM